MAIRTIRLEGDEILHKKSKEVDKIDERVVELVNDMIETMHKYNGVGLAAVQVGVLRRVFVVDVGDEHGLIEFINPEIIETSGNQVYCEGCLSVPGRNANVNRPAKIKIRATNRHGEEFELEAEGILAICICHEFDHLEGILFIDKAIDGEIIEAGSDE